MSSFQGMCAIRARRCSPCRRQPLLEHALAGGKVNRTRTPSQLGIELMPYSLGHASAPVSAWELRLGGNRHGRGQGGSITRTPASRRPMDRGTGLRPLQARSTHPRIHCRTGPTTRRTSAWIDPRLGPSTVAITSPPPNTTRDGQMASPWTSRQPRQIIGAFDSRGRGPAIAHRACGH